MVVIFVLSLWIQFAWNWECIAHSIWLLGIGDMSRVPTPHNGTMSCLRIWFVRTVDC